MMRKLTETDLTNIIGTMVEGYQVEAARIKRGVFSDSDHYGILLGKCDEGYYVTWQWHLLENESVSVYWGHYHMENREAALRDYENRDLDEKPFKVTIIETLKRTVTVDSKSQDEAVEILSSEWHNSKHILGADDFHGVEFIIATDEPE